MQERAAQSKGRAPPTETQAEMVMKEVYNWIISEEIKAGITGKIYLYLR